MNPAKYLICLLSDYGVKEHRSEIKSCLHCFTVTKARFPAGVTQSIQYGKEIQKLAVYFSNYQLLPYSRTAQLFKDLLGHLPILIQTFNLSPIDT
jgi:transposase